MPSAAIFGSLTWLPVASRLPRGYQEIRDAETDNYARRGKDTLKMLRPSDVAHVLAMLVTQAPQSFASEVILRPTQKP